MLSKETIFKHLSRVSLKEKRCLPKEQGIYFLITCEQLVYIGASKCIHHRLGSGFTHHPVYFWLERQVQKNLQLPRGIRWRNESERLLYNQQFNQLRHQLELETVAAWWLMPTTREDMIAIERELIKIYVPKLNTVGVTKNLSFIEICA